MRIMIIIIGLLAAPALAQTDCREKIGGGGYTCYDYGIGPADPGPSLNPHVGQDSGWQNQQEDSYDEGYRDGYRRGLYPDRWSPEDDLY